MNIFKATPEDIPQLETLINSAYRGEESKKGWTTEADLLTSKRINAEGIKKLMDEPNAVLLKCCSDDDTFIGCVYLKKNDNKMYLGVLTVSPTLQAGGIGKKILKASEEYAVEKKCDTMEMRVISIRKELIAWYERHGYNKTDETTPYIPDPNFSIPTQPLEFIMMEKSLS